jgi:hypothetical protein
MCQGPVLRTTVTAGLFAAQSHSQRSQRAPPPPSDTPRTLTVALRHRCEGEEELTTVAVLAAVGHAQYARRIVLELQARLLESGGESSGQREVNSGGALNSAARQRDSRSFQMPTFSSLYLPP